MKNIKNLSIDEIFNLAVTNQQNKNLIYAEELYKKIIKKEPQNIPANFNLGLLYRQLKDYKKSITQYEKVIKIKPNHIDAYNNLGSVYEILKDYKKSISQYEKAIEINPNFAQGYYNLGVALQGQSNFEKAISNYKKAIEIKPDYAKSYNNLGSVYEILKDYKKAITQYEKAIEINPNFALAYYGLSFSNMNINKKDKALTFVNKALKIEPEMVKAANLKSSILNSVAPYWHTEMINDKKRNSFYYSALKSLIKNTSSVLEIGTGSGLLSIMAAKLGAKKVDTCEENNIIAGIANEIINENNLNNKINIIIKKSNDIKVGVDINEPANILLSELFSNNFLGEGVLSSLEDAKRRLLTSEAKIIPEFGSVMISLFGGDRISNRIYAEEYEGIKLKKFNKINSKKYLLHNQDIEVNLMSNAIEAFKFDFLNKKNFFPEEKKIEIQTIKKGKIFGVIQWIKIGMFDGLEYENDPRLRDYGSHWQYVLYLFDNPKDVSDGEKIIVTAKHEKNSIWFF